MSDARSPVNPSAGEIQARFANLRLALRAALEPHVRRTLGGRAAARKLGLDKSLGWKVFQLAFAADEETAASHIPGVRAWEKLFSALEQRQVNMVAAKNLRSAIDSLESALVSNKIKRGSIPELFLNGTVSQSSGRHLLRIRRDATRTANSIFGVRIEARVACFLVAPSTTHGMVDLAGLTMIHAPEFLSSRAPLQLYVPLLAWSESSAAIETQGGSLPTNAATGNALEPLVIDLSSRGLTADELKRDAEDKRKAIYFFGRRQDRTEPLSLCFAELQLEVGSMYGTMNDSSASLGIPIEEPIDLLVFDVCVHRSIPMSGSIEAGVTDSRPPRRDGDRPKFDQRIRTEARLVEIDSLALPAPISAHSATYGELVRRGASALATTIDDYRLHRFAIAYPPTNAYLFARWKLPSPPSE